MRTLTTETGSIYDIEDGRVRRRNNNWGKRGDGHWQQLLNTLPPSSLVGEQAVFVLVSLAHLGPDDEGNPQGNGSTATRRVTSRVVTDSHWDANQEVRR